MPFLVLANDNKFKVHLLFLNGKKFVKKKRYIQCL